MFVESLLDAQLAQGLLLRLRPEVADEFSDAGEPHEHLPEQEGILGGKVRTVFAQCHPLSSDGGVTPFVRDDLPRDQVLTRPTPLAFLPHPLASRGGRMRQR